MRVYIHDWVIIRVRKTLSSDLAGFRATITYLIALGTAASCMLLSLLLSLHCQLDLFWRKQIRLFTWLFFSEFFSATVLHTVCRLNNAREETCNCILQLWDSQTYFLSAYLLLSICPTHRIVKDVFHILVISTQSHKVLNKSRVENF